MVGVVVHGAYLSYECWLCSVYGLIMDVSCIYAVVVTLAFPLEHFVSFQIQLKSVGTTLLSMQRCVPWMLPVLSFSHDTGSSCWHLLKPFSLQPLCVQAAGWAVLIFLFIFFAISIARLVIFIHRRKEEKRRRQLVDCDTTDDPPPGPV